MDRLPAAVFFGLVAIAQLSVAKASSQQIAGQQSSLRSESAAIDLPVLPLAPRGKSTILGGEIRSVDPVRDELMLKAFGQKPMKILFDERTQIYRDGKKTSLRDLNSSERASVQTVLDGTVVYAISIHMLSQSPEGEYEGRVLNYNPDTHELLVSSVLSRERIKLIVPANTKVARVGQPAFSSQASGTSDLVRSALISVKFESDGKGRGIVSQISILATPGSTFAYNGYLSALDLHSGVLVLVDSLNGKDYQISFDPARLPTAHSLHSGDHVVVTAGFDGARYVASSITAN
jgi:hypothetical protein